MSRKDWENGSLQNKLIKAIIRHLCICKQDFRTKIVRNDIGVLNCKETPLKNYLYDSCSYDSEMERNNITHSIISDIASVEVYGKIPRHTVRIPTYADGTYSLDFMYVINRASVLIRLCPACHYDFVWWNFFFCHKQAPVLILPQCLLFWNLQKDFHRGRYYRTKSLKFAN